MNVPICKYKPVCDENEEKIIPEQKTPKRHHGSTKRKKYILSDEERQRRRELGKKYIKNLEKYREKAIEVIRTPENRAKASERAKAFWKNKERRKKIVDQMCITRGCPEWRKKNKERLKKEREENPEVMQMLLKKVEIMKKANKVYKIKKKKKRINDYCGVITMSELKKLQND